MSRRVGLAIPILPEQPEVERAEPEEVEQAEPKETQKPKKK